MHSVRKFHSKSSNANLEADDANNFAGRDAWPPACRPSYAHKSIVTEHKEFCEIIEMVSSKAHL
jgi:hypothetical protein